MSPLPLALTPIAPPNKNSVLSFFVTLSSHLSHFGLIQIGYGNQIPSLLFVQPLLSQSKTLMAPRPCPYCARNSSYLGNLPTPGHGMTAPSFAFAPTACELATLPTSATLVLRDANTVARKVIQIRTMLNTVRSASNQVSPTSAPTQCIASVVVESMPQMT